MKLSCSSAVSGIGEEYKEICQIYSKFDKNVLCEWNFNFNLVVQSILMWFLSILMQEDADRL